MNRKIAFGATLAALMGALSACSIGGMGGIGGNFGSSQEPASTSEDGSKAYSEGPVEDSSYEESRTYEDSWKASSEEFISESSEYSVVQLTSFTGYQVENFANYTSFGFGSAFEEGEESGEGFVRARLSSSMSDEIKTSALPFYLLGETSEGVEKVAISNGSSSMELPICQCKDAGDFVFFELGAYEYGWDQNGQLLYSLNAYSFGYDGMYGGSAFFLSKKTGNVYNARWDPEIGDYSILSIENGGGVTYVRFNWGDNVSNVLYRLEEKDWSLEFTATKISLDIVPGFDRHYIDRFGNLLTDSGIVTPDIKNHRFSTYFPDDDGQYLLNPKTKKIVYFSEDKTHCYALEGDGEFHESEDALDGFIAYYYFSISDEQSRNECFEDLRSQSDVLYCLLDGCDAYCVRTVDSNIADRYGNRSCFVSLYSGDDFACYCYLGCTINEFSPLENGILLCKSGWEPDASYYVVRGNDVYFYQKGLIKENLVSRETTKLTLDLGECSLTGISVDGYGYLRLSLIDDDFNSTEAYLEMDDTISFENKYVPSGGDYVSYPLSDY